MKARNRAHRPQRRTNNRKAGVTISLANNELLPVNHINLVTASGLEEIQPSKLTGHLVGQKALGLSCLPGLWCPPFFVISSDCFTTVQDKSSKKNISQSIKSALSGFNLTSTSRVLIRSSGVTETLDARGQLDSLECPVNEIWSQAKKLHAELLAQLSRTNNEISGAIHFVVQESVHLVAKGHLSNERRLSHEARDFVAEFESSFGVVGHIEAVAIRPWRTGKFADPLKLSCTSRAAIGIALKQVGNWAMQFSCRIHFEWVWNGAAIFIVQADRATDNGGVSPRSVVPTDIPIFEKDSLRVFRTADSNDYEKFRKLSNANLYSKLGYTMPPFYVIKDQEIISALLNGTLTDDLAADLRILTQRPLIIRTDGLNIPSTKREMLPRSDELRSLDDAKLWFSSKFATAINEASIADAGLCLIAHHFIPSVASAWARAEPGNPVVRIESLWGIPEGLYWHSHDTFEVDTGSRDIDPGGIGNQPAYKHRERCRYKGTFIAANDAGQWVPQTTDADHDWVRSIKLKKWIDEIAKTTRLLAEHCSEAISVMWFIDNHKNASLHRVLPWFHSASPLENGPKAAPRRKRHSTNDLVIRCWNDWEQLKILATSGVIIERVLMAPEDAELIRNASFATELALLAKEKDFVVELSGGILSHAYYILSREGCRVECVDLYGAGEDIVEFNKLVRDKIPEIIRERGERIETIRLTGDALVTALRQKLVEEAFEALDASSGDDLIGELADIQEVLLALASVLNITPSSLEQERLRKRKRRGGFEDGLMLLKTSSPQSIAKSTNDVQTNNDSLATESEQEEHIVSISDPNAIPVNPTYRRPDLRTIDGAIEKLLTFKVDIEALRNFQQQLSFDMPISQAGENAFLLTVQLDREKAKIRGRIRLQLGPTQMTFTF